MTLNQVEPYSVELLEMPQKEAGTPWYLHLLRDESGQDLIEYALLTGFITLATVSAMDTISSKLSTILNSFSAAV